MAKKFCRSLILRIVVDLFIVRELIIAIICFNNFLPRHSFCDFQKVAYNLNYSILSFSLLHYM